jgi:DNA-binding transcriptional MerR regulator
MTIGQLSLRSGVPVRTLRFYADAGVLPEAGRSAAGYRLFGPDAVARARLVRTLRELGVGLDEVKRVLAGEASLHDVAAAHARALDAQIGVLRLQRAVLRAVARSTRPEELERMNDLTTLTAEERHRILEEYLEDVFSDQSSPVADRLRMGAPELPDDPSAEQVAAWVELAQLLRDPDFVRASRRMAERTRAAGAEPDGGHAAVGAIDEHADAAVRAGVDPGSPAALAVIERVEQLTPGGGGNRAELAERLEAFTDRRVFRYWTLVSIVNGWAQAPASETSADAWEWYANALRAHSDGPGVLP